MPPGDGENLILTGFMGTGKTVVGQEIARRLGRPFVDMDGLIEERDGRRVADIFAQEGEEQFRRMEAALCRELAARQGWVIATGGGSLITDANREILSASGPIVCLTARPDEILRRLAAVDDRPLLDGRDRAAAIDALLSDRAEAYGRMPLHVDTSGLAVEQVADAVLALAATLPAVDRVIPVRHPGASYDVHMGRGLLPQAGSLLRQNGIAGGYVLVTSAKLSDRYAVPVVGSLRAAGFEGTVCAMSDAEADKTLDTVRELYEWFLDSGLDRQGEVLALGGGVVGDAAGFAAATYLRGVQLVQLPTTLLAMVDSSIGGKVAVDHPRGKNLIGAFKPPALVIADPDVLATLAPSEFASGLAEVVKASLLGDRQLFEQIETHGPAPLPWLIERAVRVKARFVEADPYEAGQRMLLNLGHTFGHALELLSGYAMSHGQAVAAGLVAAAHLSAQLGHCDPSLPLRIEAVLGRLGLPTRYEQYAPDQIWQAMATDKKRRGGDLRFVLLRGVGDAFLSEARGRRQYPEVTRGDVLAVLETLRWGTPPMPGQRQRTAEAHPSCNGALQEGDV